MKSTSKRSHDKGVSLKEKTKSRILSLKKNSGHRTRSRGRNRDGNAVDIELNNQNNDDSDQSKNHIMYTNINGLESSSNSSDSDFESDSNSDPLGITASIPVASIATIDTIDTIDTNEASDAIDPVTTKSHKYTAPNHSSTKPDLERSPQPAVTFYPIMSAVNSPDTSDNENGASKFSKSPMTLVSAASALSLHGSPVALHSSSKSTFSTSDAFVAGDRTNSACTKNMVHATRLPRNQIKKRVMLGTGSKETGLKLSLSGRKKSSKFFKLPPREDTKWFVAFGCVCVPVALFALLELVFFVQLCREDFYLFAPNLEATRSPCKVEKVDAQLGSAASGWLLCCLAMLLCRLFSLRNIFFYDKIYNAARYDESSLFCEFCHDFAMKVSVACAVSGVLLSVTFHAIFVDFYDSHVLSKVFYVPREMLSVVWLWECLLSCVILVLSGMRRHTLNSEGCRCVLSATGLLNIICVAAILLILCNFEPPDASANSARFATLVTSVAPNGTEGESVRVIELCEDVAGGWYAESFSKQVDFDHVGEFEVRDPDWNNFTNFSSLRVYTAVTAVLAEIDCGVVKYEHRAPSDAVYELDCNLTLWQRSYVRGNDTDMRGNMVSIGKVGKDGFWRAEDGVNEEVIELGVAYKTCEMVQTPLIVEPLTRDEEDEVMDAESEVVIEFNVCFDEMRYYGVYYTPVSNGLSLF